MKLLIFLLPILNLGSAINHHHPPQLSDPRLEKIQHNSWMLKEDTGGGDDFIIDFSDEILDHHTDVCVNDLDGRVKAANFVIREMC